MDLQQQEVVAFDDSTLCIAGPGSGKTSVLTEKGRKLLSEGRNILCICFTRAAAAEMASRVPGLPACTIHSFCCGAVGWREPASGQLQDGYPLLLHRFLMEQREDRRTYDWILVDEMQDLNPIELDVVLSLVGDKIFAVGDPYQSIYGFQEAMGPDIIPRLTGIGCNTFELVNNYRSSEFIVKKLNKWYSRGLKGLGPKNLDTTAILCRRNDDVFEVSSFLKQSKIPHTIKLAAGVSEMREYSVLGESLIKVMTIHSSKGREFNRVILYSWYPSADLEEEKRVYYVAMSRASRGFYQCRTLSDLLPLLD